MKIEIAMNERMAERGSSLLRLIQNNEMPVLDLLVREAVQNSLDAALPGEGSVRIDFDVRNFHRENLAQHFEGITERLNDVYSETEYRLLEIRDSHTYGLTGPLHDRDCHAGEYGNLIKLIYHIGMPQQKEGSGGSWGLGKTVYFRLGIGLVIYYSRVQESSGEYSSRLAACLVEDESKPTALLKDKGNHRGIAWWGGAAGDNSTKPITNETEIETILSSLGVTPYEEDETGTTIIIPFLRNDLRSGNQFVSLEDEEQTPLEAPWWTNSDEEYISVALQRWYAPRLMNPQYKHGRWLRAKVNGKGITRNDFLSVFGIIQDLYNTAIGSKAAEQRQGIEIQCLPVNIRNTFADKQLAGWISFAKLTMEQLKLNPPYNQLSPWLQAFGRQMGFENNPALISYVRKPGMLVGYEYTGKWIDGIPKASDKVYIVGLFVANSDNTLLETNPKNPELPFKLEEYIRGCEKADHTSWADWTPNKKNPLIIDRIQRNTVNLISKTFSEKPSQPAGRKDLVLSKLLADVLLPPEGFGTFGGISNPRPPGGGGPGIKGRNARFLNLHPPVFEKERVRLDYELYCGKQEGPLVIKLKVISESGNIDANTWEGEKGTGIKFPVRVDTFTVEKILYIKNNTVEDSGKAVVDNQNPVSSFKKYQISLLSSTRFGQPCELLLTYDDAFIGQTIHGSLWIVPEDRTFRPTVDVEHVQGGKPA